MENSTLIILSVVFSAVIIVIIIAVVKHRIRIEELEYRIRDNECILKSMVNQNIENLYKDMNMLVEFLDLEVEEKPQTTKFVKKTYQTLWAEQETTNKQLIIIRIEEWKHTS